MLQIGYHLSIGKGYENKGINKNEKIGVCMDTCHVNDAGYDIKNNLDVVLEEFDKVIEID